MRPACRQRRPAVGLGFPLISHRLVVQLAGHAFAAGRRKLHAGGACSPSSTERIRLSEGGEDQRLVTSAAKSLGAGSRGTVLLRQGGESDIGGHAGGKCENPPSPCRVLPATASTRRGKNGAGKFVAPGYWMRSFRAMAPGLRQLFPWRQQNKTISLTDPSPLLTLRG